MVNFGYPYNDIVICKDSTDYLGWLYCGTSKFKVRTLKCSNFIKIFWDRFGNSHSGSYYYTSVTSVEQKLKVHWNGIQKTFLLSCFTSESEQAENSLVLPTYWLHNCAF